MLITILKISDRCTHTSDSPGGTEGRGYKAWESELGGPGFNFQGWLCFLCPLISLALLSAVMVCGEVMKD